MAHKHKTITEIALEHGPTFRDAIHDLLRDMPQPIQDVYNRAPELLADNDRLRQINAELVATLEQFAGCDLHEGNCASLDIANKRIRNVARAALAKSKP